MSLEQRRIGVPRPTMGLEKLTRTEARVVIRLVGGLEVRGTIHLPPGLRTIDLLNRETDAFLAVTRATLSDGGREDQRSFFAVNRAHILILRELIDGE